MAKRAHNHTEVAGIEGLQLAGGKMPFAARDECTVYGGELHGHQRGNMLPKSQFAGDLHSAA